ncbi:MAG: hypothetical protein OES20_17405 [Gammaproteobacteria bacterium]|nr:hypothetical protein [Gammaproteobacteria bacterium]MDH3859933.1 hypothetical protein [Gammaproteobacteria bacterium]
MDKDTKLQNDIKNTFDQQTLSAETRDALHAARLAALDHGSRKPLPGWIPATALASIALVVIGAFLYRGINEFELPQVAADELAILTSEDELELLEELEFYVWFDEDISPDTQG